MSFIGTKNINSATTKEKIRTLQRTKPEAAACLGEVLQTEIEDKNPNPSKKQGSIDRYTRNLLQTLFSAEIKEQSIDPKQVQKEEKSNDAPGEPNHGTQGAKEKLLEVLAPISNATGSTLGSLANIARNTMGSDFALNPAILAIVDKVNPDFGNTIDTVFKKIKADELSHLPNGATGSIRSLASTVSDKLGMPFGLAEDLYTGVQNINKEISETVDSLSTSVFNMFFSPQGILDVPIPVSKAKSLLESVAGSSSVSGILQQKVGGFDGVKAVTEQLEQYTSKFSSFLSDPASLAKNFMPPEVTKGLNMLRDPQAALSKIIPGGMGDQLKKIGNIPGVGLAGNGGFGFADVLDQVSADTIPKAFKKYGPQLEGLVGSLLNRQNPDVPDVHERQAQPNPPSVGEASTNPNIKTVQGVPVQETPRPLVLPTKQPQTSSSLQGDTGGEIKTSLTQQPTIRL